MAYRGTTLSATSSAWLSAASPIARSMALSQKLLPSVGTKICSNISSLLAVQMSPECRRSEHGLSFSIERPAVLHGADARNVLGGDARGVLVCRTLHHAHVADDPLVDEDTRPGIGP